MSLIKSVAIVGRPNVGKSRLFNRLAGRRISIVHDRPGVTRDVVVADSPEGYTLMDTGGIGMLPDMTPLEIQDATEYQADFAIRAADLLLFVVDGREGLIPLDESLSRKFRKMGKEPILVVNKLDEPENIYSISEFDRLGFKNVVGVSAEHGIGFQDLLDEISSKIPTHENVLPSGNDSDRTRIAFIGRPNVGKSSLCNRLLEMDRLIVSDVPGTTRETVELDLDFKIQNSEDTWKFRLFDTAGLKRHKRIDSTLDFFSAVRTKKAIESVDVVFLVLDAREGVTKQDKIMANHVLKEGRALSILVNKWDLALESFRKDPLPGYEDEKDFRKNYIKSIRKELFLPESPISFVSAHTGYSIKDFLQVARDLDARMDKTLPTSALNKIIGEMWEHRPPAKIKGKRFKVFYAVQVESRPFRVKLFCNREEHLNDQYRRYLEKGIQQKFGLSGCPLKFSLAGKEARYQEEKA